jgi:hypothetical protein
MQTSCSRVSSLLVENCSSTALNSLGLQWDYICALHSGRSTYGGMAHRPAGHRPLQIGRNYRLSGVHLSWPDVCLIGCVGVVWILDVNGQLIACCHSRASQPTATSLPVEVKGKMSTASQK